MLLTLLQLLWMVSMTGLVLFGLIFTRTKNILSTWRAGRYYKLNPYKSLTFIGENFVDEKMSEVRITVENINGKSENPRRYRNNILPVKYNLNIETWMTTNLFTEKLLQWDAEFKKNYFLICNCQVHQVLAKNKWGFYVA